MRFLALVKHYIINIEFLNSPFCSLKGPNEWLFYASYLCFCVGHFELCLHDKVWDLPTLNFHLVFIDIFCVQRSKRRVS